MMVTVLHISAFLTYYINLDLYVKSKSKQLKEAPLRPVISNHFMTTIIKSECTVEEFREQHDLETKKLNVLIDYYDNSLIIKEIRDVILKDKVCNNNYNLPLITLYHIIVENWKAIHWSNCTV